MPRGAIPDYLVRPKEPPALPADPRALINSATLRALSGGISNVALDRWMYGNKSTNTPPLRPDFPKPVKVIGGRRYWRLQDILDWLAENDEPSEDREHRARQRLSKRRRGPVESTAS